MSRIRSALPLTLLEVYRLPVAGRRYAAGADPAEGSPQSDDSALEVLDTENGEEVACLAGKFEPAVFADHISRLCAWYNGAPVLVERQNHGHAVLLALKAFGTRRLLGLDGKEGWVSSEQGKHILYDNCANAIQHHEVIIHSFETFTQLCNIEGATLRAPQGFSDDRAIAFALAVQAKLKAPRSPGEQDLRQDPAGKSAVETMPPGVWLS